MKHITNKNAHSKWGLLTLCGISLCLCGCAAPIPDGQTYQVQEVGVEQNIRYGIVEGVRPVVLNRNETNVGLGTGAILGGIAASQIGHGWGSVAAGVAGIVAGGMAGQAIERNLSQTSGVEITVMLDNAQTIAITQPATEVFNVGEKVKIIGSGSRVRVIH